MSAPNTPITPVTIENDRRVLELLSQTFNDVSSASTEIINLEAILNLPKGTEHFVADLHGEHEAFRHILKNASGNIKRKVTEIFGTTMREQEIRELCTLIYYPERKLEYIKASENDLDDFYNITLHQLIKGVSKRFIEVHPLKGAQGTAARICLHHRGAASRVIVRRQQAALLQPHHRNHHHHRTGRRIHCGAVQRNPAVKHRPAAHTRRHI